MIGILLMVAFVPVFEVFRRVIVRVGNSGRIKQTHERGKTTRRAIVRRCRLQHQGVRSGIGGIEHFDLVFQGRKEKGGLTAHQFRNSVTSKQPATINRGVRPANQPFFVSDYSAGSKGFVIRRFKKDSREDDYRTAWKFFTENRS